jgi:nicotinate-nucleotide adenylyltransferase
MRIGFFGGSFDPPHLGHLAVATTAAKAFDLDKILIAPTGRQPLKPDGPSAPFADRLEMVSLLCASETNSPAVDLEPSAIDAPHADGSPNYTADTLLLLRNQLGSSDCLFVLLGADAFVSLPKWKSYGTLLEIADWIVVSRPGVPLHRIDQLHLTDGQLERVHLLKDVHEPASATDIRVLLKSGSNRVDLLPASILDYVRAHHLYGT